MMLRSTPSYSPIAFAGAAYTTMADQQCSQTAPASGCSSISPHTAHGGAKSAPSSASASCRIFVGEFDARRVAPETFETVELPGRRREDVDDEIEVIDEHPLGALIPFEVRGSYVLGFECLLHRIGNRVNLPR